MLCRLRSRAALYIAIGLFLAGLSLTAMANTPVTKSQMESFVYWTLAVVLFTCLGSAAAFLSYLLSRMERSFEASVRRLEASVAQSFDALHSHDAFAGAHYTASEHNHGPMNEKLAAVEEKLDQLILEHKVIRGSEDEVCKFVRSVAARRDPSDSPKPKRADDSGDDYRALRGKQ